MSSAFLSDTRFTRYSERIGYPPSFKPATEVKLRNQTGAAIGITVDHAAHADKIVNGWGNRRRSSVAAVAWPIRLTKGQVSG